MATRDNDRVRFRYGRCLNDECEKCKTKEVIEVGVRKDFVCPVCGKELHECPPPKKSNKGMLLGIIAAAVVVVGGAVVFFAMSGSEPQAQLLTEPKIEAMETVSVEGASDTSTAEDTLATTEPVKTAETSSKKADLGYATWSGRTKNGLPNDESGTMTFKQSHLIDSRDPQKRVAQPGDYIIGEYADGKLVQGIWYDKANGVKGSIIIGK